MGLLNGWQGREEEERDGERKRELEMSCLIKGGREDELLTWKETSACTFPAVWLLFLGEVVPVTRNCRRKCNWNQVEVQLLDLAFLSLLHMQCKCQPRTEHDMTRHDRRQRLVGLPAGLQHCPYLIASVPILAARVCTPRHMHACLVAACTTQLQLPPTATVCLLASRSRTPLRYQRVSHSTSAIHRSKASSCLRQTAADRRSSSE